jgi:transposase
MGRPKPKIVEMDTNDLEEILRRVETKRATTEDYESIRTLSHSYVHLIELLKDKNTKIGRLRKLLFGASTEKTDTVLGDKAEASTSSPDADDSESSEQSDPAEDSRPPPKGHGRNGADAYHGGEQIDVPHESFQPGDPCPECAEGTIYEQARPGVLVRLVGQAPVQAKVYRLQKLRCNLCGKVYTAQSPAEVGPKKYDATVASMIGLLKYGSGLPFNRLDGLQGSFGIPLPASTQWEIVRDAFEFVKPAYAELTRQAAQGEVLHNDDTTVRILAMMGKRGQEAALAASLAEDSADESAGNMSAKRRGMFTSGIVSICEGRKMALFFSGRQHAGENLTDVLNQRAETLGPPIQMCDALSRNLPTELETIVANCLAHGRRQFVEVVDRFPDQCGHVLEALKVVYRNDAIARKRELSPEARLAFHQAESRPVMETLHAWLERQFEDRLVEPNSSLGGAIAYMLRHWTKLTLFLRQPGAPLDNNLCERVLKRAILHRKNSLFYKTAKGALVGDAYMSLIHTCGLCGANPFDYLTELQRHADSVTALPHEWMPWNYRTALPGDVA